MEGWMEEEGGRKDGEREGAWGKERGSRGEVGKERRT